MKKLKNLITVTALIVSVCISSTLLGCGSKTQSQNTASSTTSTGSQSQGKPDINTIVKDLVSAGTINQSQADKIAAAFEKDSTPGPTSPLESLVKDKTITEAQENAVMQKVMAATGGMGGGAQGGTIPQGGVSEINTQGATKKWTDVAYASQSSSQKLDIYLPNSGNGPFPVIVAIHGGGFKVGDKNSGEVNDMLTGLNHGYAVVTVNYRLSGEAKFPAAVYDVKAAIRFIKANASKYNLNPDKIAAWGDSAGANLASMLGTSAGVKSLEDLSMGNANQSSNVQAVADFYGPINFLVMDEQFKSSGKASSATHNSADSFESQYMGAQLSTITDKVKQANPTTYISSSTVPFFIENGTADTNVPTQQSVDFAAALEKVIGKNKVTYIQLQGAGHGGSQFDTTENLNKVFSFLDKYLK